MKNKNEKGVLGGDEALWRKDLIRFGEGREGGREGGRQDLLISTLEFWDFVKSQSGAANKVRTLLLLLCFLLLAWMYGWTFSFSPFRLYVVQLCGIQAFVT